MGNCKSCSKKTNGAIKTGLCWDCFLTKANPSKRLDVKSKLSEQKIREKNPQWKGNNVSYRGLHKWLRLNWGKPSLCEYCGAINKKVYDWANITGKYTRERVDYKRLCRGCHIKLDRYHSISF